MLLAFALRALPLTAQSLWFDEGWSWHLANMPLLDMARVTAADRSPPLYYALLHVWIALAGDTELAMRLLSSLMDVVGLAGLIALTRRLTDSRSASLLAGLLHGFSPFMLWYAHETRMYALVAALGVLSTYWLWRWLHADATERGRHRFALIAVALLLAATYSHYYAVFLLLAHGVLVLVATLAQRAASWRDSLLARYALLVVAFLLLLAPWLVVASVGFAYDDGFYFPLNTIEGRLWEWLQGYASAGLARPLPAGWWALIAGGLLLGALGFARARRWAALGAVVVLTVLPLLAATTAVRVVYPYRSVFHPRYLIYVVPMSLVWCAGSLAGRGRWRWLTGAVAGGALGLLWLPGALAYLTEPSLQREDTRAAVRHVVEALEPGDVVVMSRDNFAVRYYWREVEHPLIALPQGLHGVLHDDAEVLRQLNRAQPRRVRLMLWQDDVVDPQRFIESSLWGNGYQIGEYNFAQIRLPLYQITAQPLQPLPSRPVGGVFGDVLELRAFWQRAQGVAGDWFYVVLEWSPRAPIDRDYKVFVHVRDANGQVVFQRDKQPLNDLLPMRRWQVSQIVRDAYAMVIPASVPPGRYHVVVGVYDGESNVRLPVSHATRSLGDALRLDDVEVLPR